MYLCVIIKSLEAIKVTDCSKNRCRQFVIKHSLLILRLRWKKFVFMFSPSYDYVKHNVMDTSLVFLWRKKKSAQHCLQYLQLGHRFHCNTNFLLHFFLL